MTRHYLIAFVAVLSLVLSGCSGEKAEETVWGDYVVACGDTDLYIVDASKSTDDSLAVLWHWNVFESYGQIPDDYRHKIRVLDDCKPVDGGEHLLLTSSSCPTWMREEYGYRPRRLLAYHLRNPRRWRMNSGIPSRMNSKK